MFQGGSGDEDGGGGDASFGMLDESGGPLAKAGADMMGGGGGSIGPPTTHPISLPASQVSQKKITKTANQIYKIMEQIEELVCLYKIQNLRKMYLSSSFQTYKLSTLYRPELISVRGIFVGNEKVVEGVTSLQEVSKTYEWEGEGKYISIFVAHVTKYVQMQGPSSSSSAEPRNRAKGWQSEN